jgi:septal ring factor EnvC (AmiA/AmiB activator)
VQAAELEKQLASLRAQLSTAQGAMVQEQKARIDRVEKQMKLARSRKLIESKFEMAIGETVVVGTSKIGGGDKGLVVLLTSVAAGGK